MSLNAKPKRLLDIKKSETKFPTVLYVPRQVETSITLLLSPETDIVLRSLMVITKHACQEPQNAHDLYQRGIFTKLTSLLYHEDLHVLRFTLDLLSQLVAFPEVLNEFELESNRPYVLKIRMHYLQSKDNFVMEHTARILSKLVTRVVLEELVVTDMVCQKVFENLREAKDPDIQRNNLEFLYEIVCDQDRVKKVAKVEQFSFSFIICYTKGEISTITELAVGVLKKLIITTSRLFWEKIRLERVAEKILVVVFEEDKKHLHSSVLELIINLSVDRDIVDDLIKTVIFTEWIKWVSTCPEEYLLDSSTIFVRVTNYVEFRIYLFGIEIVDAILSLFRSNHSLVLCNACVCVSNMSTVSIACERMITPVIIKCLIELLVHKEVANVEMAVTALHNFLKRSENTKHMVIAFNGTDLIVNLCRNTRNGVSPDNYVKIMDIIHIYATISEYCDRIMNEDTYGYLLELYATDPSSVIARKAINILGCYVNREHLRNYFIELEGAKKVVEKMGIIKNEMLLKDSLIFVHNICCYKEITPYFLSAGIINKIDLIGAELEDTVPFIETIKDMMYDLYLPLKFHVKRRLDVEDRITYRFYMVLSGCKRNLPFLEIFEMMQCCPISTIYTVDFGAPASLLYETIYKSSSHSLGSSQKVASKLSQKRKSKLSIESSQSLSAIPEDEVVVNRTKILQMRIPAPSNSHYVPQDPYLTEYVEQIYHKVYSPKVSLCLDHKIKLLSLFVASKLSGLDEYYDGDKVSRIWLARHKLHISALKEKLNNCIIPIGYLRIGGRCERALLFKALADRLAIPSAFVKGSCDYYWNEVVLLPSKLGETLRYGVVDLMKNIGRIYEVGSAEADTYCGLVNSN